MLRHMHDDDRPAPTSRRIGRREALTTLGGLGLSGALGASGALGGLSWTDTADGAATCVLSPEVTEGPYWIQNGITRRDIRGSRPGLPLEIVFTVQDARTCEPIRNADVEIWHCDAGGVYSGFERASQGGPGGGGPPGGAQEPTDSKRYLRGHGRSDSAGRVRFLTIFPGWYRGRTPHIHLKVHVGGDVVHTGQVFFNERTTAAVYRQSPYRSHGQPDTSHAEDSIYAEAGRSRAVLRLRRRGRAKRGYRGAITLGVAT